MLYIIKLVVNIIKMLKLSKNKKILLNVDTGIDDALAIILIYRYLANNIIGITTCGGNVGADQTTQNTLAIISLLESRIPVYQGSAKPLERNAYINASNYHGKNGLCNIDLPTKNKIKGVKAPDFIIQAIKKYQEKLAIISLAPPTNIAQAILKNPKIAKYINQIYLMGGAVNVHGNQTQDAEFNFFQDPEAVKIIFDNIENISIIPLDVTNQCIIGKKDLKQFVPNRINNFIIEAIKNWYSFFGDLKQRRFELYDPLAVSVALGDFLKFKKIKIDIDLKNKKGAIIKGNYLINYAYKVKSDEFKKFFIDSLNNF